MGGFKKFLMQGNLITIAVGLVVALAFSGLILAFTTNIINPLLSAIMPGTSVGLGWYLKPHHTTATFLNLGAFISAVIYFIIFMAVIYFVIVVPYKRYMARQGKTVFGDPPPTKTCPACLSSDLPVAATKCLHCATDQPAAAGAAG